VKNEFPLHYSTSNENVFVRFVISKKLIVLAYILAVETIFSEVSGYIPLK
jgi:hypothetical protein